MKKSKNFFGSKIFNITTFYAFRFSSSPLIFGNLPLLALAKGGGEGGIRTPDDVAAIHAFQASRLNHSRTSPITNEFYLLKTYSSILIFFALPLRLFRHSFSVLLAIDITSFSLFKVSFLYALAYSNH